MYSIWIWTRKEARKYKDCAVDTLYAEVYKLRMTVPANNIEITRSTSLPTRRTIFICPVLRCADCPKQFKSVCPMYEIFKDSARRKVVKP